MKKIFFALLFIGVFQMLYAANGDSTVVRVWDKFHMNTYGAFDTKVLLPPASQKSQRIWLKYSVGCLSNGQCEWDYDITLYARQKTGAKDSTLQQLPYLKVNGTAMDSIVYSSAITWINTFNATTKLTDSLPSATKLITLYSDTLNPLKITDSIIAYAANYYRFMFDTTGAKTDSIWVASTNTLYQHSNKYYKVLEVYNNFELGRMITPYAKSFPKNFQYDYVYDVTDYAKYLNDSTELRIFYSGYSYGFTATWDLIYIEGTPAKEVIDIVNIYNGGFQYGGATSIEESLTEKPFTVPANTASVKAKIIITGHGGESNENCSEFCAKNYFLKLNNQQIAKQLVWRDDCGSNAITAQGGTWIYNRANWCPGESIRSFEYDLAVNAGSSNTINLDMDDFTANGYASYKIALQLIYYKDNSYQLDAAIEDILAPSKSNWNSKINPICDNGVAVLKNWGKKPLTDAWIAYKMGSGQETGKMWTGNLQYGETANVLLTDMIWPTDLTDRTFKVQVKTINGQQITADENSANNIAYSTFDLPITLPQTFIIETRTNNVPEQNSYTITDALGSILKSRTFPTANTLYRDTMTLGFGCYTFKLNDDGNNGLSWWAATSEGNGSLRFVSPPPIKVLQNFSGDFGTFTQVNFRVQHAVGIAEQTITNSDITTYPSPASDIIKVEGAVFAKAILVDVSGKTISTYQNIANGLDVKTIPSGIYILQLITSDNQIINKKISIQK